MSYIESLQKRIKELEKKNASLAQELSVKMKKYGLYWLDCPEAFDEESENKIPVLEEVPDKEIRNDDGKPTHILIEGDNYHALTCLNFTHRGKIDVIYIDPPYNTGEDFVYKDKRYLSEFPNGQLIDANHPLRHSTWLSFMKKRLTLARDLLSERGVIFISIDDNEQANLKLLCDQVFGAKQNRKSSASKKQSNYNFDFIGTIPWRKRTAKSDVPHNLSQDYEWVLCYARRDFKAGIEKETRKYYETPDLPGRPWRVHDMTKQTSADEREHSFFTMTNPKNGNEYPASERRTWSITEETFPEYYAAHRIVFPGDYDFLKIDKPQMRYFKDEDEKKAGEFFGFTTVSSYLPKIVGMTEDGTKDMSALFPKKEFSFPKPVSLIKYLIKAATPINRPTVILDFFAGSGTTLHAILELNDETGGNRQCILVQEQGEARICENVTYKRAEKAIEGYESNTDTSSELFRVNITLSRLKNPDKILAESEKVKADNEAKFNEVTIEVKDGALVVTGSSTKKSNIPALGGSLKYYRTKFVGKHGCKDALDEDRDELAANAGTMLALAEGTLDAVSVPKKADGYWCHYSDGLHKHTLVYYSCRSKELPSLSKEADRIRAKDKDAKLSIYVYTVGGCAEAYDTEFDDMRNITLKAIPEPILDIYRTVNGD